MERKPGWRDWLHLVVIVAGVLIVAALVIGAIVNVNQSQADRGCKADPDVCADR